ncbi:Predicted dehydrogenase [Flexibacter flexilis DSM 6793]|uniref:Predicted dehydrogenase n=1 Tax=Flexibacter flexilis DSM 6793 TaxID=927664 RepID=A0A1I1N0Z7_9BACT|nr:Gfo/Idh/MocA family oxidoreductase [Flexibacter flexilis]SFC89148.1 Predicted dehydrogenase [Flexibacter flexilis DSM 6793]
MLSPESPLLVIGAGSIGERHIGNLQAKGFRNIYVLRSRNLPMRNIDASTVKVLTKWNEVEAVKPVAAFITSPTALHVEQTLACVRAGMHVLVEKPLSHNLEGLDALKQAISEKGVYVYIAYMLRFHPLLKRMRAFVEAETYGKLLSFTTHWGEYLPDWHPWEDYRESYAARKELGGGAALTLSHDLDMSNWLVGRPIASFMSLANRKSALEVSVEAGADFLIKYENDVTGHVHLNFYEQPATRFMHFVFETGTVYFDYYKATLTFRTKTTTEVVSLNNFDRNAMFLEQADAFLSKINSYTVAESLAGVAESEQLIKMCNTL